MFESCFRKVGQIDLPGFSGTRIMMMPVVIAETDSLPDDLAHWRDAFGEMSWMAEARHHGEVGYLTIDEKVVEPGRTHRRQGLHVDGIYRAHAGSWGGGGWGGGYGSWGGGWGGGYTGSWGGGGWGSRGNGMLTVASHVGCRAWSQTFDGWPGDEGECDHLADQCGDATVFGPGEVYWVDGLAVHESIPMTEPTARQFVRISMPNNCPWFEGYTENPLGIVPTGPILPRRAFMDVQ